MPADTTEQLETQLLSHFGDPELVIRIPDRVFTEDPECGHVNCDA